MVLKTVDKEKINPKKLLRERRSYCDKMIDDLEKQGVDFFRPSEDGGSLHIDKDFLTLPKNITEISPRDLGE